MWDIILVILALLLGVIGLLGTVVPILPGPPFTYIGLLLMHWSRYAEYTTNFLLSFLVLTVVVTFMDNVLPVWMTKKYGGSKYATRGSLAGLIIGLLFFPPWGMILGSFIGAFAGELIYDNRNTSKALKVGMASFVAFLLGTGAKLTLSV
ncbi:DUF456 domain-containing protein, partial [Alistipes sp. OttesenSCG-928-L06]|nr:DUF456 domain-containing protein [Alistipes sp. OttesenSCG-928-L06]